MLYARPTPPREFLMSLNEALSLAVLPHNFSMKFSSQVILVINYPTDIAVGILEAGSIKYWLQSPAGRNISGQTNNYSAPNIQATSSL